MSRVLTQAERLRYNHVSPSVLDRARIRSIPWMPGSFLGVTLGRNVFLAVDQPDDGTSPLIAHELVHVDQYAERGVLGFLGWYLMDFGRQLIEHRNWMNAYRAIEAESEARDLTNEWLREHHRRY